MKIRSVRTIAPRERFEHEAANLVIEIDGIEYTITDSREAAGRIIIRSSMIPMSVTPLGYGDGITIGVDMIRAGLVECDECGRLVSSVRDISTHNDPEQRFACLECAGDEPETDQPAPELYPAG
jgi:hypothetical protein